MEITSKRFANETGYRQSSNLAAEVLVYVEDLEEVLGVENNDWQVVCRHKRFYNRNKSCGEEEEQSDITECGSDEDAIY